MKQPVNLDMTIGDVVDKYPDAADVMLGYGLHCVGCAVNPYETIQQGALGHGMDEATTQQMLSDINLAITKEPDYPLNPEGITLSPRAVETLQAISESEGKGGFGLTIKATKHDEGLEYFLDLVESAEDGQQTMQWEGVNMYIDTDSLAAMKPSLIDYVRLGEDQEGFKIMSLKQQDSSEKAGCSSGGCGCGRGGC